SRLDEGPDADAALGTGHDGEGAGQPCGAPRCRARPRAVVVVPGTPRDVMTLTYALITPAWNEEANLERVIRSIVAQALLPVAWVIVSDGSTDRTDEIARSYAARHGWIRLLRRERSAVRSFAGKAHAVNAGYQALASLDFDLIGNLDADISVPPDYY